MKKIICHNCGESRVIKNYGKTTTTREIQSPYCIKCTGFGGYFRQQGIKYPTNYWLEQQGYSSSAPYTLYCDCGSEQTYSTKYTLVRVLLTTGKCGKCSRSMKREWNQHTRDRVYLSMKNTILGTNCSTIEELHKHPKWIKKYNTKDYILYAEAVDRMSRTNLKRYKPDLYQLWLSNKWDGTDMNQYSIDHIKEKRWCFDNDISREECADISNLQIITMQENIDKHQEQVN
jgi:hypothetical protein